MDAADTTRLIPAKMLNALAYCPRLFHLEFVQQEWAPNAWTEEGTWAHRAVDRSREALPEEARAGARLRSVELEAPGEGITTRLDVLEVGEGEVVPVETKRGQPPRVEGGAYEPERVQVAAQALALREHGWRVPHGVIYFAGARRRVTITLDDALIARTRALVVEARALMEQAQAPPPLRHSPRCAGCSLAPICLPDELEALRSGGEAKEEARGGEDRVRLAQTALDARRPLYIQRFAARLSKEGDVLRVSFQGEVLGEVRPREISHVALMGACSVTPQAQAVLLEHGAPILHCSYGGRLQGVTHGMPHKNIDRRIRQFRAADDPAVSLRIAQELVAAKLHNSRVLLRRNLPEADPEAQRELKRLERRARHADAPSTLLGIEGAGAALWFERLPRLLKRREGWGEAFDFRARNRRPPRDGVNALLSFGYSLLVRELTVAALGVGWDPFLGFYHRPRQGRPALALDLMEPYRPVLVDSTVLAALNNGEVRPEHLEAHPPHGVLLTAEGRRAFIQAWERRLSDTFTHPALGYTISWRRALEVHLRLLDAWLAGEIPDVPTLTIR